MPKNRAAILIGVNRTGGMTPLNSAARNAQEVGNWLRQEGFTQVVTFTDDTGAVKIKEIKDTLKEWVDAQIYEQLLIYFSGHGLWKNETELWLLSDAPRDADAAINFLESVLLAKDCGIPNVTMISDACRTGPGNNKQLGAMRGSVIFPNDDVQRQRRAKIDTFLAAVASTAAYEIPIDGTVESVFTYCLRQAYKKPDKDMVSTIDEDGIKIRVVPNRKLEDYLQREVADTLKSVEKTLEQSPDVNVTSSDDTYIARASEPAAEPAPPRIDIKGVILNTLNNVRSIILPDTTFYDLQPAPQAPAHIGEVAAVAIADALEQAPPVSIKRLRAINALADSSGFNQAMETAQITDPSIGHFETKTGFTITGIGVADAMATGGARAEILHPGHADSPAVVRLMPENFYPGCTVILRFDNGNGMPLAALHGYIGHVVVEDGRVVNINYVPSDNSSRWRAYFEKKSKIERLRAAASAAARFGVFRIGNATNAIDLADRIRTEKAFDPTLGIYAAYAYSEAGRDDDVASVLRYMGEDLTADIFDVAMLAGRVRGPLQSHAPRLLPFCPLLTQGWNLLRAHRIELPEVLDDAQDNLVAALWTTFEPSRVGLILDAVRQGALP
jgi:Caspase domain